MYIWAFLTLDFRLMKNIIFGLFVVVVLGGLFPGCNQELDLYADYKDIPIVYGLLDYSDDTVWIKVTRAFSGGNANELALIPDSSNYAYKLDVRIIGRKQGEDKPAIVFDTLTITNKRAGDSIFYYPDQLMYYAVANLDVDAQYRLEVDNKGQVLEAETPMISNFSIGYPRNTINFMSDGNIEWTSVKNGKRYQVHYFFNYRQLVPGSSDTTDHVISWSLGSVASKDVQGGEDMYRTYSGDAFYSRLENELPEIENVKRWAGDVDVHVACGTQVLQNYIEINNASGSLLQEVPSYTNITNGLGIFAARHTPMKSARLSTQSLNKLVEQYDLGFLYPVK